MPVRGNGRSRISGHKYFGPTGIGLLYGRQELLAEMEPYQGGGEMIRSVTFEKTEYAVAPHKFEAGTPDTVGAISVGAVVDYMQKIGMEAIAAHEHDLLTYAAERFGEVPQLLPFTEATTPHLSPSGGTLQSLNTVNIAQRPVQQLVLRHLSIFRSAHPHAPRAASEAVRFPPSSHSSLLQPARRALPPGAALRPPARRAPQLGAALR
ncbi:MAG: aminotransferase class V-fold PLP-dependent enzyme, partial [bacterium]|nr:aminotransferase class V-fold PLP-dependent enzyme [bacterium]